MLLNKFVWKLRRASRMGAAEITWRVGQVARTFAEAAGLGRADRVIEPSGAPGTGPLAVSEGVIGSAPYVFAAEKILAGKLDIFALREESIGFPPRWNRDARTGTTVPMWFGKLLDYRDDSVVGDIKYLWEPNRHLHLVTLAQAFRLSGDPRFAQGCKTLIDSWIEQCPYPLGPNWTSSL